MCPIFYMVFQSVSLQSYDKSLPVPGLLFTMLNTFFALSLLVFLFFLYFWLLYPSWHPAVCLSIKIFTSLCMDMEVKEARKRRIPEWPSLAQLPLQLNIDTSGQWTWRKKKIILYWDILFREVCVLYLNTISWYKGLIKINQNQLTFCSYISIY